MSDQRGAFRDGEADAWFARNSGLPTGNSIVQSVLVQRVSAHVREGDSVLEVGCSNGFNLAALRQHKDIRAYGVDPSPEAVARPASASLSLNVATADELPFGPSSMDVVWYGFCLYVVDRDLLMTVVKEGDRVLKDGGTLIIHDFDPDIPRKRAYHHVPGLWSYKMDHAKLFLANPAYSLIEKASFTFDKFEWTESAGDRLGLWVIRKNLAGAYP